MTPTDDKPFIYRVALGWLRDLASEPSTGHPWPYTGWDDRLLADQVRFLDAQAELGMNYNAVWGLFADRRWPVPLENVIDERREAMLSAFVQAAHRRGVKVLSGLGVYSWGFEEVIDKVPGVSAGDRKVMCPSRPAAWDWQRRVLDFLMDARWGLDGVSMQSADLGRCQCPACSKLSPAGYHAEILGRCADYIRAQRPDWTVGQACWGLRLEEPADFEHVLRISEKVDYMIEVQERSARAGRRGEIARGLGCALGSVGGVFAEPPMHWDRLRWFLPCGLGSARALRRLHADGGRACEHYYRPFANPVEEVSWRTGAAMLWHGHLAHDSQGHLGPAGSSPSSAKEEREEAAHGRDARDTHGQDAHATRTELTPEQSLSAALGVVYDATGATLDALCDWFARGEDAYFSRASFQAGDGPISLEPLWWDDDPAAEGPPIYLRDRLTPAARAEYASDLRELKAELEGMALPNQTAKHRTLKCIDGTLKDLAALAT
jgi:hypothetical protein